MNSQITVKETKSEKYPPRTYHNAKTSDWTVAFALDFNTLGEKLTANAAAEKYTDIHFNTDPLIAARKLFKAMRDNDVRILNVAGNGIYSLIEKGWNEERVNRYVHAVIAKAHEYHPLEKIISGGQTGVDMAGGVAGYLLELPVELTLPNGFKQKNAQHKETHSTEEGIRQQVLDMAQVILDNPIELIPPTKSRSPSPR